VPSAGSFRRSWKRPTPVVDRASFGSFMRSLVRREPADTLRFDNLRLFVDVFVDVSDLFDGIYRSAPQRVWIVAPCLSTNLYKSQRICRDRWFH